MVILFEIGEYVVGEVVERRIIAKDANGRLLSHQMCDDDILKFGFPKPPENSISIGALDAVPSSIPVYSDTSDPLYTKVVVVKADYDEITLDGKGLAIAGKSGPGELYEPQVARLVESIYENDILKQLRYEVPSTGNEVTLDLGEVLNRLDDNELRPPVKAESDIEDPDLVIPSGKLCCPCLTPEFIRREDTVITRIKFDTGLELNTADAVLLQDNAGVYLKGLQLIHPNNAHAYFRAPANETERDNFEELPRF